MAAPGPGREAPGIELGTPRPGAPLRPPINAAAEGARRGPPRVGGGLPVCVPEDVAGARDRAARAFVVYGTLPSYRAMRDRGGAAGPEDVAVVGDEASV